MAFAAIKGKIFKKNLRANTERLKRKQRRLVQLYWVFMPSGKPSQI